MRLQDEETGKDGAIHALYARGLGGKAWQRASTLLEAELFSCQLSSISPLPINLTLRRLPLVVHIHPILSTYAVFLPVPEPPSITTLQPLIARSIQGKSISLGGDILLQIAGSQGIHSAITGVDATHDVAKVLDAEHLARHRMPRNLLSAHRPQMLDPAQCGFLDRLLVSLSSSASGQSSVNLRKVSRARAYTRTYMRAHTHAFRVSAGTQHAWQTSNLNASIATLLCLDGRRLLCSELHSHGQTAQHNQTDAKRERQGERP